jgi:hypothetical protein
MDVAAHSGTPRRIRLMAFYCFSFRSAFIREADCVFQRGTAQVLARGQFGKYDAAARKYCECFPT